MDSQNKSPKCSDLLLYDLGINRFESCLSDSNGNQVCGLVFSTKFVVSRLIWVKAEHKQILKFIQIIVINILDLT